MKKQYWLRSLFIALPLFLAGCQEESADVFVIKTGGFTPIEISGFPPIQIVGFPGIAGKVGATGTTSGNTEQPNVAGKPSLAKVYGYRGREEAQRAATCSKLFLEGYSCLLSGIKPLGLHKVGDITVEDIEKRLVVSHDWMAESFLAALRHINDQALLNLFKPLNAVVISYEVQPSFYHALTASVYLDPRYLWRNSEDWSTIYQTPKKAKDAGRRALSEAMRLDYRESFQDEFITMAIKRYIDGSGKVFGMLDEPADTASRTVDEVAPPLFRLLAHELAHANDFLPMEQLITLGDTETVAHGLSVTQTGVASGYLSLVLKGQHPLASDLLYEAAQVAFEGKPITERVRQMTGAKAGGEFDQDGAARFYGYSNTEEDLATIFEDFMMYKKYGALPDVAFLRKPASDNASCNDYKIEWGQRARLADSRVRQKADLIGARLLGKDVSGYLPPANKGPVDMQTEQGWCDSMHHTPLY